MVKTRAILASALLLAAGWASADSLMLWDESLLMKAVPERDALWLYSFNLSSPDPLSSWFGPLVPATADDTADVEPDLAMFPGVNASYRRNVLVWSKENPESGSFDIALAFFDLPSLPEAGDIVWLTNGPGDESSPKVVVDPHGRTHVVWRGADGIPQYRVIGERGSVIWAEAANGLPEGEVEGLDIMTDSEGRIWVAVGVSGDVDQVVILSQGVPGEDDNPPGGGEIILEPLRLDHSEVQTYGGVAQSAEFLQPEFMLFDGIPVVVWETTETVLGVPTLHYRYRMAGHWRPDPEVLGNTRIPLVNGVTRSDAITVVRNMIRLLLTERMENPELPPDLQPIMPGELPRTLPDVRQDLSLR